jgi:hypothetical protein
MRQYPFFTGENASFLTALDSAGIITAGELACAINKWIDTQPKGMRRPSLTAISE